MDNAELAYLLGMIAGKGILRRHSTDTDVIVEIPHKSFEIEGMEAPLYVKASLDDIRKAIEPLIDTPLRSTQETTKTTLQFKKNNQDFLIREINRYFSGFRDFDDFRIPSEIFTSPTDIKKQFLMGFSDVTAHVRSSNYAYGLLFNQRVYIEIPNNWYIVVDICNLLKSIDIPVQNIDWAHPNMRDPKLEKYNTGKTTFWNKEHQIKIYAEEFEKIGFQITHKQRALKQLSNTNKEEWNKLVYQKVSSTRSNDMRNVWQKRLNNIASQHHRFYWDTKEINKPKPHHPMENSEVLPEEIRGNHYDSWRAICHDMGYIR